MKQTNKITVLLSFLTLGLFSACDQDQIGEEYTIGEGVTFNCSSLPDVVVPANNPTFTVDVYRTNTVGALTGNVSISAVQPDETTLSGCSVSNYSFADGEGRTTVTVNVEPLAVGIDLTVTLTLSDNIAVSGTATTKMVVSKDYSWDLLGIGTYTDNWGWGITYDVEIYKADGFDRWRVKEPYTESTINDDGEWEDWLSPNNLPDYVTFWKYGDVVRYSPFTLGLNYYGNEGLIWAYPAYYFNGTTESHSKWIDSKTVQLAPYYYVPDLGGGWNYTNYDGVIIITLP